MAEWASPAPAPPPDSITSPPPPPLPPLPARSKTRSRPPNPVSTKDDPFQPGTYVVQVPKEQILRVPPSENAFIAEEHRRKMHSRRRRCPSCLRFLAWLISITLIIIFTVGLAIGIFFVVARPGIPSFALNTLISKRLQNKARQEYNLKLRSHNPSLKMEYCYEAGGNVALSHKGKEIAIGRTPSFCQPSMSSRLFKLKIEGSYANLPKQTAPQPLLLLIQFPVRLKVGGMQVWAWSLDISCDLKVSGLASTNKTCIVSQGCRAKMH